MLLEQAGAHVPHVHAADLKRGFVVMEDLGDTQYLTLLRTGRGVDKLYGEALTTLANIQVRGLRAAAALEPYDRAPLERELNLMPEWFLRKHLGLDLSPEERALLTVTHEFLINEALLQPQVFVHRDFHSRNLMVLPQSKTDNRGPGVIDFQDALRGPIGYDLVSLLKDCYISWSRERVERWVRGYRRVLGNLGANVGDSEYQFMRWFDLIGVQRHLKVLGVFSRLWHRDGKIGYLADLPLTFEYVRDACRRYPELVEFERWLEWRVAPQIPLANARQKEKPARRKPVRKAAAKPKRAKKTVIKRKAAIKKNTAKKNRSRPARAARAKKKVSRATRTSRKTRLQRTPMRGKTTRRRTKTAVKRRSKPVLRRGAKHALKRRRSRRLPK
jgi:aminoglycoside/choline kinase family phosphotransferase